MTVRSQLIWIPASRDATSALAEGSKFGFNLSSPNGTEVSLHRPAVVVNVGAVVLFNLEFTAGWVCM